MYLTTNLTMKLFKLRVLKHWSYLADFVLIVLGIILALSLDCHLNTILFLKLTNRLVVKALCQSNDLTLNYGG